MVLVKQPKCAASSRSCRHPPRPCWGRQHKSRVRWVIRNIVKFETVLQLVKVIVVRFHRFLTLGTLKRRGFVTMESVARCVRTD